MKKIVSFKNSLVAKLMLAFMLVAVPPMLIASNVATNLVNKTVNRNIESWLNDASNYMFYLIEESIEEAMAASVLLNERLAAPVIMLTEDELRYLPDLDVDYVQARNSEGKVIYSNGPEVRIDDEPLFAGSNFRWATMGEGKRELGLVASRMVPAWDGSIRVVDFVSWFEVQLAEQESDQPFEFCILLPEGDDFKQVYASADSPAHVLPNSVAQALRQGADSYFIPDTDWTDNTPNAHFMLKSLRAENGELLAVYMSSIRLLHTEQWGPSTRTLFWAFFILGSLLSLCCGYLLAKHIVRPIKQLNYGVKSIANGEFGYQVKVAGKDEVSELSGGFNLMSRQLEIMQRELLQSVRQERHRMLGEVALGFAHEIRNPLVVIKTSAEVVHSKLGEQMQEARLLGFVVEEVGRIDNLITEFLSFAKPAPLKLEYFSLRALVDEVLTISGAELKKRGVNARVDDDTSDSTILGERNQFNQVLLNLVLNAMDAMPGGGDLEVTLYGKSPNICLDIHDSGVGIPEDLLTTIHLPFITTKKNGLGLGLAKVYAIVEEHGGSVTFRSKAGEGTVFTVCLHQ